MAASIAVLPLLLQFIPLVHAANWHLDLSHTVAQETIDPIVSPNAVGGHLHKVIGGAGFGASYDYDSYAGSSCSSLSIQADKSNYWVPCESTQAISRPRPSRPSLHVRVVR